MTPEEALDSALERIVVLSEGNPGATAVLSSIAVTPHANRAFDAFQRHGLTGRRIWAAYKCCCGESADALVDVALNGDLAALVAKAEGLG